MATRTNHIFTEFPTVLHYSMTFGTGPHRGAVGGPSYFRQVDGFACLQELQVFVAAAVVVTAIRARAPAFPGPLALPAELIGPPLPRRADGTLHTQVVQLFPLNFCFALRTRLIFAVIRSNQASYVLLKVLHLFRSQISQFANLLIGPRLIASSRPFHQCRTPEFVIALVQLMAANLCEIGRCNEVTTRHLCL